MDTNSLINHANDLVTIAVKKGFSVTKFVTPVEASDILRMFSQRKDITILKEGGFKDAERVRIIFLNSSWGDWGRKDIVSVLRINYNQQDKIGHRDVLGSILNLGIKRETMGDILINTSQAFIICIPEITEYIIGNLSRIGHTRVTIEQISIEQLPDRQEKVDIKTITVSSIRLDSVISGVFNVSRSSASKLIMQGKVKVEYIECLKKDKELNENTMLSVRGFGRIKILLIEGRTRKDKIRLRVGIYV